MDSKSNLGVFLVLLVPLVPKVVAVIQVFRDHQEQKAIEVLWVLLDILGRKEIWDSLVNLPLHI